MMELPAILSLVRQGRWREAVRDFSHTELTTRHKALESTRALAARVGPAKVSEDFQRDLATAEEVARGERIRRAFEREAQR